jgi:CheY-like chemotaxis protein
MSALAKSDVLVVDDDPGIRLLIGIALGRVGVTFTLACDGIEAIECLKTADFNLVLLDVMMPRLDGVGFVRHLREWEERKGLRPVVLLMTAAPEREELLKTADTVQAVIAKPFDVWEIADLVHDCVTSRCA